MLQRCNTIGFMPIFQWMYALWWMLQWCNSVRVVPLIARGWRGTSLPRVNVRKEIQRHRCWVFLWRHAYNGTFSDGLLKKSATPTALFPTNHMLTQGSLHYRLATLGYQKRNTYGVEMYLFWYNLFYFTTWIFGMFRGDKHYLQHGFKWFVKRYVSRYNSISNTPCYNLHQMAM